MSTVSGKIWLRLLRDNGRYEDDPPPLSLYTYTDQGGKTAHKICYDFGAVTSFLDSPFVESPRLAWSLGAITNYGKDLLKAMEGRDADAT